MRKWYIMPSSTPERQIRDMQTAYFYTHNRCLNKRGPFNILPSLQIMFYAGSKVTIHWQTRIHGT